MFQHRINAKASYQQETVETYLNRGNWSRSSQLVGPKCVSLRLGFSNVVYYFNC